MGKDAATTKSLKPILVLLAIVLIAYGVYGYLYVPSRAFSYPPAKCPFTFGTSYGVQTGPCLFSLYALAIGAGILLFSLPFILPRK